MDNIGTRIYVLSILFIQILLCISCANGRNEMIFSESESLLNTDPDSALLVLNSIVYPEKLSEKEYNRYILLKIQAEYKSYQDITSDSVILSVRDYYLEKKDNPNLALASYYCGCYYRECDDGENAMRYFLEADKYAGKGDDNNLRGLILSAIGVILLDQFDSEGAIRYFRESAALDRLTGNLNNAAVSYMQIGDCFQYLEQPDSALHYYMKCLHLVDEGNLCHEQSNIRQNLGILYARKGDLAKANQLLREALEHAPNQDDQIKIYLSLLDLYVENHQIDSVNFYMNHLLQKKDSIKDIYVKANLFQALSEREEMLGNYPEALEYNEMYAENLLQIITINSDKRLLELQKKYDYEKIHLHNTRLRLERSYTFIGLLVLVFCIVLSIIFLSREYRRRENVMLELEDKVSQLNSLAKKYDEKEKTFVSYLLKHFKVLKKVSSLEIYINKKQSHKDEFWIKKFNDIVYGQDTLNWDILYDVMNELHNGFFIKLKALYPQLKEVDFRILCLTYSGFSTEEIAIVLNLSINTINTKRSAIRKGLAIPSFANLRDFLDDKLL